MRPNRQRAAELKVEIAALSDAYSDAWVAGRFDLADEAREEMNDLKHQLFLTGVVDDQDQGGGR